MKVVNRMRNMLYDAGVGFEMTASQMAKRGNIPLGSVHAVLYSIEGMPYFNKGDKMGSEFLWSLIDCVANDGLPVSDVISAEAGPEDIVTRDRTIEELRGQLRDTKKLYREALRDDTLAKRVTASAVSVINAMPSAVPRPRAITPSTTSEQAIVALNSCLHFGEVVSPAATMGLGNYSPAMAAARWQYFIDTTLDLVFDHHGRETIKKAYVVNVGDNTSGDIHLELKTTNEFPIGEQMVRSAYLLAAGLRDLAAEFEEVEFIGTVGNHGRFEKKPSFKDKTNNADWVVYNLMKALLADTPNITVTIPDAPWSTPNIMGREFFFSHGDNIRSYFGFPWYDTQRFTTAVAQMLAAAGRPYPQYWGLGHFHQTNQSDLSYGEWLFTGSVKGPDEYSINKLRAATRPNQLLFGVHPRRSVSFRYPVELSDADPRIQGRYVGYADPDWCAE